MRLLFLTQWFDPEPTPKGLEFARQLVRRGFEVEVVTGFPNYPGGKVYAGYHIRPIQRETLNGVQITRLPLYPSHDSSKLGRMLNYVSFMLSALIYVLFIARRPDVSYVYHPPLTVGLVGGLLKLLRRVPFVLDVQDLWPHTLRATGMVNSDRVLSLVGCICSWMYRRASHIVVNSPGFERTLISDGVPAEKVQVIYNWAAEAMLYSGDGDVPRCLQQPGRFKCLFAGTMGRAQGIEVLLLAAARLAREAPRVSIYIIGGGIESEMLAAHAARMGLANVVVLPRVPMNEVGVVLASADLLLVTLKRDPLFEITVPSKTQAYMAVGKPILMSVAGDAAALVTRARCGIAVEPGDADALAIAIRRMSDLSKPELDFLGRNGQRFYREHLSIEVGVDRFASLLRGLTGQNAP